MNQMNHLIRQYGLIVILGPLATLVVTLISVAYHGSRGLLLPISTGLLLTVGLAWISKWYPANLAKRIERDAPIRWSIWRNNAEVGSVSDAQYAAMQRDAVCDRRNAIAQLQNVGRVVINVLDKLVIAVPVLLFWGALAFALCSPEFFMAVVREFQNGDTASNLPFIRFLLLFTIIHSMMAFGLMALAGYNFGFVDCYSASVNRMLRRHCNIPDDGDIHLVQTLHDEITATA
jgi:hypothetical protein